MFKLDHLMVEVDDPQQAANNVVERLGLPLAWSLIENEGYTSIGVNFGDLNIEFIHFNVRLVIRETHFSKLSGAAFTAQGSLDDAKNLFKEKGLSYRIGEEAEAHTTIVIEEQKLSPTLFLVDHHFDTSDRKNKFREDFAACQGGIHKIGRLALLEFDQTFNQTKADTVLDTFSIKPSDMNRIRFESSTDEIIVIDDLIDNLEIVIGYNS